MNTPIQLIREISELALRHQELEKSPAMNTMRTGPAIFQAILAYATGGKKSLQFNIHAGDETLRTIDTLRTMGFTCIETTESNQQVTVLEISW